MASNLNPKTAGLTLTGVLLGAEQYPSTVQQGVAGNTGFNLYKPALVWCDASEWRLAETSGTLYGAVLMGAGIYDLYAYARVNAGGAAGTFCLKFDGTTVLHGTANVGAVQGTSLAYTPTGNAWEGITMTASCDGGVTMITTAVSIFARQYA